MTKLHIPAVLSLLRDTEMGIREIATCFRCTPGAVTHAVKTATDLTPSEYRIKHAGWVGQGGGQRATSPRRVREITTVYDLGLPMAQVAEIFGMSVDTVRLVLRSQGREARKNGSYRSLNLPEEEIAKQYKSGISTVSLGAHYGCHEHTIRRVLDRQGVPRRRI